MNQNEEPGWREYWQSGGDAKKLNKQPHPKIKKILIILIIVLLIIISINSLLKPTGPLTGKTKTETERDPYKIVSGQKTVTKEMQAYIDNLKSYINSVNALGTNINKNIESTGTHIDKDIYEEYILNYKTIIDFPIELKDYESTLLEKYNMIYDNLPDPNTIIDREKYKIIVNAINTSDFLDIIAEYLDKNGYFYDYDDATGHLTIHIKEPNP